MDQDQIILGRIDSVWALSVMVSSLEKFAIFRLKRLLGAIIQFLLIFLFISNPIFYHVNVTKKNPVQFKKD